MLDGNPDGAGGQNRIHLSTGWEIIGYGNDVDNVTKILPCSKVIHIRAVDGVELVRYRNAIVLPGLLILIRWVARNPFHKADESCPLYRRRLGAIIFETFEARKIEVERGIYSRQGYLGGGLRPSRGRCLICLRRFLLLPLSPPLLLGLASLLTILCLVSISKFIPSQQPPASLLT